MGAEPDRLLTWEDLIVLWLPEDGLRYALLDGRLVTTPTPEIAHQRVVGDLLMAFARAEHDRLLGDALTYVAVKLSRHDIVTPDLLAMAPGRRLIGDEAIEHAPDLIVEVVNDDTRERDLGWKTSVYARCGVPEYWTADPFRGESQARTLVGGRYEAIPQVGGIFSSVVLPGLEIDVAALFAEVA